MEPVRVLTWSQMEQIDNELARYVRRAIRTPWVVDHETLATEVVQAVGPGGNFLVESHTLEHF
jgi:trimethylamine:corrinoid methyltransferase-like protein